MSALFKEKKLLDQGRVPGSQERNNPGLGS